MNNVNVDEFGIPCEIGVSACGEGVEAFWYCRVMHQRRPRLERGTWGPADRGTEPRPLAFSAKAPSIQNFHGHLSLRSRRTIVVEVVLHVCVPLILINLPFGYLCQRARSTLKSQS